jgi:hypothetical protein
MNEITIIEELAQFSSDPLGFVMYSFPWGEPGSQLANEMGPETWQVDVLSDIRDDLIRGETFNFENCIIRIARASGHGIGKSALVAWIILWAISTFEDCKGVVTANTENQLKTKTWAELAKWHRMFIGNEYFKMTATALFSRDPAHEKTWRIDMVPWSERNTESFAGLHNQGKRILVVIDEGSAVPDVIYEVTEGALTDLNTQIIWAVFGNPTRNTGRFRECFADGKYSHRWNHATIDSRSVRFTNKTQIKEWEDDYGEDSDFFRIRVKGQFPRVDSDSFISLELAREAVRRPPLPFSLNNAPLVLGVDVGRFGDDPSVIYPRKGNDAVSWKVEVHYKMNTMQLASRVAQVLLTLRASVAFVDEGGVGGGVVDRLEMLRIPVIGVDFGSGPAHDDINDGTKYANKRAEIWGRLRKWLSNAAIPEKVAGVEMTVLDELTAPRYGLVTKKAGECIQLETKKDMRKRGIKSPNIADALACTFAEVVLEPQTFELSNASQQQVTEDYNPFAIGTLQ